MIAALAFILLGQADTAGPTIPVRVDGEGYIRFLRSGKHVFGKSCTLCVHLGRLAAEDGPDLLPIIKVAGKPDSLSVDLNGTIKASYAGTVKSLGRIVLGEFSDDVRPIPSGKYFLCYGEPALGNPGDGDFGLIRSDGSESITISNPSKATAADPTPTGEVKPVIKAEANVSGDSITLGDVADNAGTASSIVLGDTPAVGITRPISRELIAAKLKQNGYPDVILSGAPRSAVTRAAQGVPEQAFIDAAVKKMTEAGLTATPITPATASPMPVPQGALELLVENVRTSGQVTSVTVAAYVNGNRFNSRTITLMSEIAKQVQMPKMGAIVQVKVKKGMVSIETRGRVIQLDPQNSQVTIEVEPTKVHLTGKVCPDATVEVQA